MIATMTILLSTDYKILFFVQYFGCPRESVHSLIWTNLAKNNKVQSTECLVFRSTEVRNPIRCSLHYSLHCRFGFSLQLMKTNFDSEAIEYPERVGLIIRPAVL
jgi:hypothetical protein